MYWRRRGKAILKVVKNLPIFYASVESPYFAPPTRRCHDEKTARGEAAYYLFPEEQPAIDMQRLTGNVSPVGAAQETHHRGDLIGPALAAERDLALHAAPVRTASRRAAHRVDRARRDTIGGDIVRRQLHRQTADEAFKASLRRVDVNPSARARVMRNAAE